MNTESIYVTIQRLKEVININILAFKQLKNPSSDLHVAPLSALHPLSVFSTRVTALSCQSQTEGSCLQNSLCTLQTGHYINKYFGNTEMLLQ